MLKTLALAFTLIPSGLIGANSASACGGSCGGCPAPCAAAAAAAPAPPTTASAPTSGNRRAYSYEPGAPVMRAPAYRSFRSNAPDAGYKIRGEFRAR